MNFPQHDRIRGFVIDLSDKIATELRYHYSFSTGTFSEIAATADVDPIVFERDDNLRLYKAIFRSLRKMLEEGEEEAGPE